MAKLDVEKVGGFAGFGGRLKSRASLETSKLSAADQQTIESLFKQPPTESSTTDSFRYKLTRQTDAGSQTVEVPEQHVPSAIQKAVRDEIV